MPDRITKKQRSYNMSRIHSKETSIEKKVRKYLYHHGFRYRKNVKDLPGTPDIVIDKYRVVIFINGCFWHQHYGCKYAVLPKSHAEYWKAKLTRNVERDIEVYQELKQMDYRVIVIWECEIKEVFEYRMKELIEEIREN